MTALVYDCNYNGLSIIQELGSLGIHVYAVDSKRNIGTYSKYATYRKCADPLINEDQFVADLIQIGRNSNKKPVLFTTNDHGAMAISKNKDKLSKYFYICLADYDIIDLLISKKKFYSWAKNNLIRVPKCWEFEDLGNLEQRDFPIIAKPESRRKSANDPAGRNRASELDKNRIHYLNSGKEVNAFIQSQTLDLKEFIYQEYIPGLTDRMYTVGVYVDQTHTVRAIFNGRKVRGFPPDIGDCIVGERAELPESINTLVKQISCDIKYQGIAEFEFKKHLHTNEFVLIEINPRSWSWIGITPSCGVNLPLLAYSDLNNTPIPALTTSKKTTTSVKYVKALQDLLNVLYLNRREGYPEFSMGLRAWINSLKADKLIIAEYNHNDILPLLYSICLFFILVIKNTVLTQVSRSR